jgi:hypothetical protein
MLTDNDQRSWVLTFFARFFAVLGTLAFVGTSFWWMSMFYLGGVSNSTMADFAKIVLEIGCIPGALLVVALVIDLKRNRTSDTGSWITRTLRHFPLLSLYPHPLRWILGFELALLLCLNLIFVRVLLFQHPH